LDAFTTEADAIYASFTAFGDYTRSSGYALSAFFVITIVVVAAGFDWRLWQFTQKQKSSLDIFKKVPKKTIQEMVALLKDDEEEADGDENRQKIADELWMTETLTMDGSHQSSRLRAVIFFRLKYALFIILLAGLAAAYAGFIIFALDIIQSDLSRVKSAGMVASRIEMCYAVTVNRVLNDSLTPYNDVVLQYAHMQSTEDLHRSADEFFFNNSASGTKSVNSSNLPTKFHAFHAQLNSYNLQYSRPRFCVFVFSWFYFFTLTGATRTIRNPLSISSREK
jgi:hypothetical protein